MRNENHRNRRQKHCGKKRCYLTREDACHNMLRLASSENFERGGMLNVYHCPHCQEFHVGTMPPSVRERYQLS